MKHLTTIALCLALCGCSVINKPPIQVIQVSADKTVATDIQLIGKPYPSSDLQLKADFEMDVTPEVRLKVESEQTGYTSIYEDGIELDDILVQKNGNHVAFDCKAVAERIVDRDLVPKVEVDCKKMHRAVIAYWEQNPPKEFGDDRGRVWVLKEAK